MAKTAKYWIYHIPGVKIGVSQKPECRVLKQQGFSEYEILEEHTNAKEVSKREIELQKQYGYPVDKIEYWKTLKWQKKGQTEESHKKRVANTNYKEARAKAASNTDYKAKVANTDYKAFQEQRVANTDWKIARAKAVIKTDYKAIVAKIDYKASRAKINWELSRKNIKKPVNQYDLQGNFIKKWDCAANAAKFLNKNPGDITSCCREKLKTAHKFIWKYA